MDKFPRKKRQLQRKKQPKMLNGLISLVQDAQAAPFTRSISLPNSSWLKNCLMTSSDQESSQSKTTKPLFSKILPSNTIWLSMTSVETTSPLLLHVFALEMIETSLFAIMSLAAVWQAMISMKSRRISAVLGTQASGLPKNAKPKKKR